ncbi:hypothetical protein ACS0PU_012078 [Formica fusca]|nr:uncharacterized protein LOC115245602 isoform X2 [Formica exsecta]
MRRQSFCPSTSNGSGGAEPLIVVEESTLGEEEADHCRRESPPRFDPDSPSLNPYLLSPWRDARKHSLPTPQCTSGITASQVRRLSERGGEGSGPSAREAAFLATLSQTPTPQSGGRRHSVVTISRVPTTLFGRNRRESVAAFPMGATRILQGRRDSSTGISGPPSNSGSTHNLQLDIMDDIAEIKAKKVRLKMYKTSSRERVCEIQPLEGDGSSTTQKYIQHQKRRFSDFSASVAASTLALRRRASEMTRPICELEVPCSTTAAGITCSNTDLISILSSLTSSASEINTCGTSDAKDEQRSSWSTKTAEQRRSRLKSSRSNSFDVSILHSTKSKTSSSSSKGAVGSLIAPSNWFAKRHQPMSKKNRYLDEESAMTFKLDKLKIVKTVKDTLVKNVDPKHKVLWDDSSGTKVDAQVLGNAIEKILTSTHRGNDAEMSGSSSGKPSVSPNKSRAGKVTSWFSSGNKEQEQTDCDSICTTLKDLFVK